MNSTHHPHPQRIAPGEVGAWLHDTEASRAVEAAALARHAPHVLMQRAGLAVARLALAVAPHAQRVWIACGPGNNGGDGLVAARHLQRAGWAVHVTLCGDAARAPDDARRALAEAVGDGLQVSAAPPDGAVDLVIDALLGLGATRAPHGAIADAIVAIEAQRDAIVLAVDLPSGLHADTGQRTGTVAVRASHTLSLLTLKPGLFTAAGRDHAGQIWLDALGETPTGDTASARLAGAAALNELAARPHASHKGSFGDVAVVGGAAGMTGAALLAARSALASGAGRVFVGLLDAAAPRYDPTRAELMFRPQWWRGDAAQIARCTVVCGCGGGEAVRDALPVLLARCPRLVLDADALNAVATDPGLRRQLRQRAGRGMATVLTPHPLEAARLLDSDSTAVQADRLRAANGLAQTLCCVVLLKGSGSVIAAPDALPVINPSGNGLLASGGSGDVLAGWIAGIWAQLAATHGERPRHERAAAANAAAPHRLAALAACTAVWAHGRAADVALARAPHSLALRADDLSDAIREVAAARRTGAAQPDL